MNYDEIISKVADSQGLPKRVVDKSYRAFWKVIREHITALPLKSELTDEEFLSLQPNVNIPSIGKLYVTLDRYKRMKRLYEKFNNLKKKE
jgi:hypothetical protein